MTEYLLSTLRSLTSLDNRGSWQNLLKRVTRYALRVTNNGVRGSRGLIVTMDDGRWTMDDVGSVAIVADNQGRVAGASSSIKRSSKEEGYVSVYEVDGPALDQTDEYGISLKDIYTAALQATETLKGEIEKSFGLDSLRRQESGDFAKVEAFNRRYVRGVRDAFRKLYINALLQQGVPQKKLSRQLERITAKVFPLRKVRELNFLGPHTSKLNIVIKEILILKDRLNKYRRWWVRFLSIDVNSIGFSTFSGEKSTDIAYAVSLTKKYNVVYIADEGTPCAV